MKLFTFCGECGYRIGRSEEGTCSEIICPKCGAKLEYRVAGGTVTVRILKHSEKTKK